MKDFKLTYRSLLMFFLSMVLGLFFMSESHAQQKKVRARINAEYVKVTGKEHYLDIKASARVERQTVPVEKIDLIIAKVEEEEETEIGKTKTDSQGTARFVIQDFNSLRPDSTGFYNLIVIFEGNDAFKKASRDVAFRDATIVTELIERDSLYFIGARITDTALDSAVVETDLTVQVERLFRPWKIGEDFYSTDDEGYIEVQIPEGIPGVDGMLNLEVVLKESDDYGTVKTVLKAPVGELIVDESTYDQRTMWSPRGKTPVVLLVITYSFIFVVWGIFLYLFINLFRIVKS